MQESASTRGGGTQNIGAMGGSKHSLLVVLKFHDEGLDVLAALLPLGDALLGVGVEALFILVLERLALESQVLVVDEVLLRLVVLILDLLLEEVGHLHTSLALLLTLLLFGDGQLLVPELPELGELPLLVLRLLLLLLHAVQLVPPALLDGLLHLEPPLLLLLEELGGLVLGLGDLLVEDLLLLVPHLHEVTDLAVDQPLLDHLLMLETLLLLGLLQVDEGLLLFGVLFDPPILLLFLYGDLGLDFEQLLVGLLELLPSLGSPLLPLEILHPFLFELFLDLLLYQLALHLLLLQLPDEVDFELL
mmetsp:Transcript_8510/g.14329  ORF Transcript_8510/g.14329 Transcript_8510/m.14329 type:complete len:304 (+) Transcript_8510:72-983(+)